VESVRRWIAAHLRKCADRIDQRGATRLLTDRSFTFEPGMGMVFRQDGRGCPLAYVGEDNYEKAHSESDANIEHAQRFAEMVRLARLLTAQAFANTGAAQRHREEWRR
jgi:hypothetical protein